MELKLWLKDREEQIARRWRAGIRAREGRREGDGDGFLGLFLDSLISFLPPCLGDQRDAGEEVWQQATHLYGSLALHRGLAAGEVVEELQLVRGVILRLLLEAPPEDWENRGFQRDLLALNNVLDVGVVQASVAYIDDLFFAHLQGSGVPEGVASEVEEEMGRQLEAFRRELRELRPAELSQGRSNGQG
ncbi:MAG: hypothetical protein ABIF09_12225 [Gemmatimonadota bacterium]